LAQRSTVQQHPVVAHLWYAPWRPSRVFDLSPNTRIHPGPHARGEPTIDETSLTDWMKTHLKVIAVPFDDADTLGHLEEDVLRTLDPPLNLKGMTDSPIRSRLAELRRPHARRRARAT
jgi:hypothetical protein